MNQRTITPQYALRDTDDDFFIRVDQASTVSLGMLINNSPPLFEAPVSGQGSSNSYTTAHVTRARIIMEDNVGKLLHMQTAISTDGSILSNLAHAEPQQFTMLEAWRYSL